MNARNRFRVVPPGEMFRDELKTLGLSASTLPGTQDVPVSCITTVLHGQREVTANAALCLKRNFGTTARVWPNLDTAATFAGRGRRGLRGCRARQAPANSGLYETKQSWTRPFLPDCQPLLRPAVKTTPPSRRPTRS